MKLHLSPRVTISSLPPRVEAVRCNDALVYYCSPYLYAASISTSRILRKLKYEDVQVLKVHGDLLYVCTSDIYILDMCSYELLDVIKLSKALISKIALFDNSILVSKVNNRVVHILERRVVLEIPVANSCEGLFLNHLFYGYYDFERVVVFSTCGTKVCDVEAGEIIGAVALESKVFVLDAHGSLTELVSGDSVDLGLSLDLCCMSQSFITGASRDVIYEIDYNGTVIGYRAFPEMIEEYSGSVRDVYSGMIPNTMEDMIMDRAKRLKGDESCVDDLSGGVDDLSGDEQSNESSHCGSDSPSTQDSFHSQPREDSVASSSSRSDASMIACLGEGFVKTSENDFVFIKDRVVSKIISFVDDVTGSVEYGDRLMLSTSSGFMKFTSLSRYSEGEYVFDSRMVRISLDSITSTKISEDIVVTGSRDKTCQVFKIIPDQDRLVFARVYEFKNFQAPIVSLAFDRGILAAVSEDNILQIYRGEQRSLASSSVEECALHFGTFENVSTQHIHTKPITHVTITPMFIITSSADRSSKVLDHNGILVKTLQSDKILNCSHDSKHIAVSSHKAIKVYHNPSLSQVAVFQSRRPVLSSCFHNGYLLGVTDVLRVYDLGKKKCVKSYDLGLANCWLFNYPFLCAENKIVILEDRSKEMHEEMLGSARALRESTVLVDRFLREGRFKEAVEVLLKRGDCKRVHKAIVQGFYSDRGLCFLDDLLKNGDLRAKVAECFLKSPSFKHSEVFNAVSRKLLQTKLDKDKKERMLQVIRKHASALDEMFVDLLSLDVFNKQP